VFSQGLLFVEPGRICQALSIPRDKRKKGRLTGTLEKQFWPILPFSQAGKVAKITAIISRKSGIL
jgi:hypothetical protein